MWKISNRVLAKLLLLALFGFLAPEVIGQQPFVTDDADVTAKRRFHFEFSNEFDWLNREATPSLRQNTANFEIAYGLIEGVEVAFSAPLITIWNNRGAFSRTVSGIGDSNISLKYNFLTERERSHRPALAINLNLELPTGDVSRQLRTKLRLNGGILFAGNETSGALGIRTRGTVFTGGGSVVREINARLDLGVELVGAVTRNFDLGKGQLQAMVGGNYSLTEKITFDFGILAGRGASPRAGVQLGISIDW